MAFSAHSRTLLVDIFSLSCNSLTDSCKTESTVGACLAPDILCLLPLLLHGLEAVSRLRENAHLPIIFVTTSDPCTLPAGFNGSIRSSHCFLQGQFLIDLTHYIVIRGVLIKEVFEVLLALMRSAASDCGKAAIRRPR